MRLGVDFPVVRNGNVLLRACDVWATAGTLYEMLLASSPDCLAARSNPLTWETH